ncbi:MAG: PEP/pyruvate-binding domain-containing protein [Bacteroidales bacterium]
MHASAPNISEIRIASAISRIVSVLPVEKAFREKLQDICEILPAAFQVTGGVSARIVFEDQIYCSTSFNETNQVFSHAFTTPDNAKGEIKLFFPDDKTIRENGLTPDSINQYMADTALLISNAISAIRLSKLLYDNTERLKELKGIRRTTEVLSKGNSLEASLMEICSFLPEAWQFPSHCVARITYGDKVFTSRQFSETGWIQKQVFETADNQKGSIEIFYLKEFPDADEGPFLKEERDLIDNLAALISGTVSGQSLRDLLTQNTERLKELRGINQTSKILKESKSISESLKTICSILPDAYQFPEDTVVRIRYENLTFTSRDFRETRHVQRQEFDTPNGSKGVIEVFYLKDFPEADEGPFLNEERNMLINLAGLIAGSASKDILNNLLYENRERLKELHVINHTSYIINQGRPIDETLQKICYIMPRSWQYSRYTAVRITYEGRTYASREFNESPWVMQESFVTFDNSLGVIEVFYLKEFPQSFEGPFLKEERQLIINLGKLISGYINSYKGKEIYSKTDLERVQPYNSGEYRQSLVKNKRPLQLFFNQQALDKYIYLDMMKYKVKEILFVATLYDAFILENEDSFFEQFMGIIYQYSLFSLPRITGVSTAEDALDVLDTARFDLVILMVGIDRESPVSLSEKIRQKKPALPIYMLLNQKSNICYFEELMPSLISINKLFVWSSNSQIFFAIVKSIEDEANVENDTRIGLVRIILLVEDSALYYSKYLQMLYSIIFDQVQQVLPEVEKNELDKICKMRSRPKILHARNYEDAMLIFNKYKDYMLCVISDVEFEKDGVPDKTAGVKLIKYIKSHILNLPIILQSSELSNEQLARSLNVGFINKNSDTLVSDLKNFLTYYLGFGDFVFRNREGKPIAVAKSLREFEALLSVIPDETFYLHALENQYSLWLMARGEIDLARIINPMRIGDIKDVGESRRLFIETLRKYREEKKKGKVLSFDETATMDEKNIVSFASGSFGGKGRGLAFINALVYNIDFGPVCKEINIKTPITAIIGTDEFEYFIEINSLHELIIKPEVTYQEIRQAFVNAKLSKNLVKKLEFFIDQIEKPIAVRSSSLSEDSLTQPFAGVFDTYIIPNNRSDKKRVLGNMMMAVKLVFASVYSDNSRTYFQAIRHRVEDERMAVVLQELVGNQYENYYYPHISGTAQSYNYYPVAHMKPEEGFAVAAIGLGSYVVEGWRSYRFSPRYPKIEMYTNKDLLNSSQRKFYALNTMKGEVDYVTDGELASLELLDIEVAEKHGTLAHCASVYNTDNDLIEPGLSQAGPRVIDFGNILKFHYIPLAETIDIMLGTIEDALGSPVEIEYAVDLNRGENGLPSFYLLQIKPLVGNQLIMNIDFGKINRNRMLLYTESSLGNGEINHIHDIVFVDIDQFDKLKTHDIAREVESINSYMNKQNLEYILIGPGRWGTRDPFLGIPVVWSQISNARVIVEVSLANFPLDSSLGSHFFHNVTSMNIGYFSVLDTSVTDFINWELLQESEAVQQTKYLKHIRFSQPLQVLMNGKQKKSVIIFND